MFNMWIQLIIELQYISPVLSSCNYPPIINYTESGIRASPPFAEGSAINYSCLSGYEPYGNGIFTCLNGNWNGLFSCKVRKCPLLKPLYNGKMYNPCREVACVIKFFCNEGYQRVGSESSYCRANGSWSHAVPECHIMECPPPPVIEHGNVNFKGEQLHVYETELSVKCIEGFIRSGSSRMYCTSNGQWTEAPACLPSNCSAYPGMDGKCIEKTKVQNLGDNRFLLFIYCTENATFIKMNHDAATCSNGHWDNLSMGCYCDCKVNVNSEGVLFGDYNPGTLLKHGEILNWSCKDGYIYATSDLLACDDGVIETPKCVSNPESGSENSSGSEKLVPLYISLSILICSAIIIYLGCLKFRRKSRNVMTKAYETSSTSENENL